MNHDFKFTPSIYNSIARFVLAYKEQPWHVYEEDWNNCHVLYDIDLHDVYITDNQTYEEITNHDFSHFELDGVIDKIEQEREAITKTEKVLVQQLQLNF